MLLRWFTWLSILLQGAAHWAYAAGYVTVDHYAHTVRWDVWTAIRFSNPDHAVWLAAVAIVLVPQGAALFLRRRFSKIGPTALYLSTVAIASLLFYVAFWHMLGATAWTPCKCGFGIHAPYPTGNDVIASTVLTVAWWLNVPVRGGSYVALWLSDSAGKSRLSALARPGVYS